MSDMATADATSPLNGASLKGAVEIAELGLRGMLTLRGDFEDPTFRDAACAAAGVAFPDRRRIVQDGDRALAWMSPDELLVLAPYDEAPALAEAAGRALAGRHHMCVVVSDARAMFRIAGDGAREVLAKGAPADLSRAAFGPGDFRRTRLGQIAAAFWQVEGAGTETFELICFRSVAAHAFDWLGAAARKGSLPGFL